MKDGAFQCGCSTVRNRVRANTLNCITVRVVALEVYRAAGEVPQAIKSIFHELQRYCRLLSSCFEDAGPEGRKGRWG